PPYPADMMNQIFSPMGTPRDSIRSDYALTDLGNKSDEVVEAAYRGSVEITKRGKRKFVLLTAGQFDRWLAVIDALRHRRG
ncbi:type II toxin-antitoxin system prevent-host-death family antitoxin, partial [Mesorhizobium australicum]|uniref:type II toxin-antitoxin system prevent-host-death family antitoxin n=1 Tax=Mesorhizobium australicum TaxID=536018 RepID=UPI00333BB23A